MAPQQEMKQFTIPMPLLNKHYKTARVLPGKTYVDRFDAEHCTKIAPQIERLILKSYQSIVLPEESKKKIIDLGTCSIFYASLHKSHLDYIAICGKMFLEGLPCPRTIAGNNLVRGIIGKSVKHFTGIDMMRWGAIPLERDSSVSHNLLNLCSRIETILRSDTPILAFPEMEAASNGTGEGKRTGRAYSGEIRNFASALFSPPIKVSKEGKKVYIVPIAVSYDFVAEDGYFGSLAKADKMKKSDNLLVAFVGRLYYTLLECHFFYKMYRLGKGNIYVDTGQPIPVEPNASKRELAHLAQQEAARCYRVTMPALVCYAISKGAKTRDELQKSIETYGAVLKKTNANFHPSLELEEGLSLTLKDLTERGVISNRTGTIPLRKPEVISYYANTIAHHFEST
jgi:glycerol-3-phosphate O-acyltransferase